MTMVPAACRRAVEGDEEASPLQHAVVVRHQLAPHRRERGHRGAHAGLEIGKGVEQGGGEHVAGDTADGVELDVHGNGAAP